MCFQVVEGRSTVCTWANKLNIPTTFILLNKPSVRKSLSLQRGLNKVQIADEAFRHVYFKYEFAWSSFASSGGRSRQSQPQSIQCWQQSSQKFAAWSNLSLNLVWIRASYSILRESSQSRYSIRTRPIIPEDGLDWSGADGQLINNENSTF